MPLKDRRSKPRPRFDALDAHRRGRELRPAALDIVLINECGGAGFAPVQPGTSPTSRICAVAFICPNQAFIHRFGALLQRARPSDCASAVENEKTAVRVFLGKPSPKVSEPLTRRICLLVPSETRATSRKSAFRCGVLWSMWWPGSAQLFAELPADFNKTPRKYPRRMPTWKARCSSSSA